MLILGQSWIATPQQTKKLKKMRGSVWWNARYYVTVGIALSTGVCLFLFCLKCKVVVLHRRDFQSQWKAITLSESEAGKWHDCTSWIVLLWPGSLCVCEGSGMKRAEKPDTDSNSLLWSSSEYKHRPTRCFTYPFNILCSHEREKKGCPVLNQVVQDRAIESDWYLKHGKDKGQT